jgi:hypothetical protein
VKKVNENCELPWDVLDIICKRLDFDDLFHFAGVCNNWRAFHKIYWTNFLTSQEPLLLISSKHPNTGKKSYTLTTISDQKVYCLKIKRPIYSSYVTTSSGYFITVGYNNSFILVNPFSRINKVINVSTFEVESLGLAIRALLAFGKCSEEFVLVVFNDIFGSGSLNVYQSRSCGWVTYSMMENQGRFADFAVFHNKIYVITNKGNIGVINLNSANITFLKLKSTPNATIATLYRWLVCCDEQLLVVDIRCGKTLPDVYKIDFSTMNYVKLETLGDIALFYVKSRNCYALSNPNRWGYERNSMYVMSITFTMECSVHSWDDKELQKYITPPTHASPGRSPRMIDWCFRHL